MTTPFLVTVPNIPLLEAGVEYNLSTGPTTFTPEDLQDMVTAANEDPSIPKPRLKIGHNDPRFSVNEFDGEPAFGKFENLRLDENGMTIVADLAGVPKWLADVMPTAYPSRSVEVWWNVTSMAGGQWRAVITAVAALGVVWPGINQLEDLPLMYGETVPDGVEVLAVAETQGGADVRKLFKGKKEGTQAAASLDDIRRAFYQDYASGDQYWWWIRDIVTDPNQLVVEDDESGQLYLMSYSSSAEGEITFGEPEPVRVEYVADKKAAAASIAAAVTAGRHVAVSYASWAESRPVNPTMGGGMNRSEAIRRLGLPEDASDEDINTALDEFNSSIRESAPTANDPGIQVSETGTPDEMLGLPPQQHPGTGDNANDQVTPPAPAPDTASAATDEEAQTALEAARASGLVVLDPGTYEALRTDAGLGRKAYETQVNSENKRVIDQALAAGKFPPARREAWEKSMAADPAGTRKMIDSRHAMVRMNDDPQRATSIEECGQDSSCLVGHRKELAGLFAFELDS